MTAKYVLRAQKTAEDTASVFQAELMNAELARLNAKAAVYQTARAAYSKALQAVLPSLEGDSIKVS